MGVFGLVVIILALALSLRVTLGYASSTFRLRYNARNDVSLKLANVKGYDVLEELSAISATVLKFLYVTFFPKLSCGQKYPRILTIFGQN